MEKYKDKDFLFTEYIVKDRTAQAIGNDFGVSKTTILNYLKKFDIKKPIENYDYEDKDFLFSEYIVKNRSAQAIADDFGVSKRTILRNLKKFDIFYLENILKFHLYLSFFPPCPFGDVS